MQTTTAMAEALGRYLDLTSAQMKLTAGNMANIDTPGFKAKGFDFEQELSRQMSGGASNASDPQVSEVDGLVARPDGSFLLKRSEIGAARDAVRLGRELGDRLRRESPTDIFT